ncbi:MAG: hypothetical protein K2J80_06820 [Oscillospiraceae bacterium]|nr:hypothetical protein [Oscillospiraceae bacterium]
MKTLFLNFFNGIKKNYKTLILAFIIACALWIVISVLTFDTITNRINGIDVQTQPTDFMTQNNLQITSELNEKVSIVIEGKRYDISDLKAADFTAEVDLSSVRSAGSYVLPLIVTPKSNRQLSITTTQPEHVSVTLDEIISKEFPVQGTADVSLPQDYYLGDITVSPATVTLTGSASLIQKVTRVEAQSTRHGNIAESLQTGSDIIVYGSSGVISEGITVSTEGITVNIPIFKKKELPLKFSIVNAPSNFDLNSLKYDIQPKSITVASPDESIDNISELDIGTIDLSEITLNATSYIPIVLPEGYKNLSGNNNARIEWDIADYNKLDFYIHVENIQINNRPNNFDVSLITNTLKVTVIGPSERIAEISASDITATANLLGAQLREGAQDVSVSVQIKGTRQSCWASGDYKVTINAQIPQEDEQ